MTGMRKGELLALKWTDINFANGEIQIRHALSYHNTDGTGYTYQEVTPKSRGSKRTLLVPNFVIDALQRHRKNQEELRLLTPDWEDHNLVFPNAQGKYRCPTGLNRVYKRFPARAGIEDAHFHATRHGHATDLLEKGVNPRVVQERLGHSNVARREHRGCIRLEIPLPI